MNRFVIIGAGAVAQTRYIPALLDNRSVSLDWVVDVDEERAERVANEAGAQYATDHAEVLDKVDAAILATPPRFHESIARDCLEAGVDLLTEKPVAMSSQSARELIDLSAREDVQYAISRQYREAPACRLLHALVEQGAIGQVESLVARFGDETDWNFASSYRVDEQLAGGGVLTDKGPHILDVVRWIVGEDLRIDSYADDSYGGLEANAELSFAVPETGATGEIEISASRNISNSIEITGTRGRLYAELGGLDVTLETENMAEKTVVRTTEREPPTASTERMARQVDRFVDSLGSDSVSSVPAETGVHILELVENCYANQQQLDKPWEQVAVTDGGDR